MAQMTSKEIRNKFVEYFKKHGHQAVASSSLIPENDPTLLFANAGMNQFKNTFLGLDPRDYKRAVTVQKCVRAGGKHNDLENVGFTARHHTFFEMLGNFSFGDYFKKDAIHFAWELLTKDLAIPKEKLYVTVHISDDEAADIWHKQEGVPRERIFRFDQDNFWRMGDTGPCGPCSEIFYDHGPGAGKESDPYKGIAAGEDRFVEIWNLVFMQFYEKAPGVMDPLPKPSVDTGSGLERVVAAMQGKVNNYDTDLFKPLMDRATELSGVVYGKDPAMTAAMRVVADHARSGAFLICDGALPSNEGRGYVLRRILRRGIRYARQISADNSPMASILPAMAEQVIETMKDVYPALGERKNHIMTTLREEEARFLSTLDQGTAILNDELKKLKTKNQKMVPGDVVFRLYDTYGFPADLTRLMSKEQGFDVDEKNFEQETEKAREKAKASWKGKSMQADEAHMITFSQTLKQAHGPTTFVGYDTLVADAEITGLSDGTQDVVSLAAGQAGIFAVARSPFYAEGGGQVGDQGTIKTEIGLARVTSTTKQNDVFMHHVQVESGTLKVKAKAHLAVSESLRRQTVGNHSATHLMHAALRKVLGTHVTQAGSLVDAQKLRFDFTHNKSMSRQEIHEVEALVNGEIAKSHSVVPKIMKHKEALQMGAMALFGEKYGDEVRVLQMGDFSTELCGGTHVQNTAQIRLFKIMSETGVSSGVRRIEAITGDHALAYLNQQSEELMVAKAAAGAHEFHLVEWVEAKKEEIKKLEREVKKAISSQIDVDKLVTQARDFKQGTAQGKLLCLDLAIDDREVLAQLTDQLKNKIQTGVVIVLGRGEATHPLIVSVSKNLNPGLSAGNILKELAGVLGGKGGGRPDFAQGAVPDVSKFTEAQKLAEKICGV